MASPTSASATTSNAIISGAYTKGQSSYTWDSLTKHLKENITANLVDVQVVTTTPDVGDPVGEEAKLFILFLCTCICGLRKLPLFLSQEYLFYKLFTCLHITFSNKCKLTTWCKTAIIYFSLKSIIDICLLFHSHDPLEKAPHIPLATQVLILANYVGLFHCGKNSIVLKSIAKKQLVLFIL